MTPKLQANLQAHGVSFDLAKTVFKDPFAIERLDDAKTWRQSGLMEAGTCAVSLTEAKPMRYSAESNTAEQDDCVGS